MERRDVPTAEAIERFHQQCHTPDKVRAHEQAVAACALALAEHTAADRELLRAACLLHDVCRTEGGRHPAAAAALLREAGYPALAEVIAQHHDLGPTPTVEAELLHLADKLTAGTTRVTITQRFERSREKCIGEEALAQWQKRFVQAQALALKYGVTP